MRKPLFLMLTPECTPYSNIQDLDMRTPEGKAKVELAQRRGDVHLRFCATLAQRQMEGCRHFVYVRSPQASGIIEQSQCRPSCIDGWCHEDRVVKVDRMMGVKCRGGGTVMFI